MKRMNLTECQFRDFLINNNFVKIQNYKEYFINSDAEVIKVHHLKNGLYSVNYIPAYATKEGLLRINLYTAGKQTSKLLHKLVYDNFIKNSDHNELTFIDSNRNNCRLDNLISINQLLDFYNKYKDKINKLS